MYKLLAITVVGGLALARADDEVEQLWLNELYYQVSGTNSMVEVVSRPKEADAEGKSDAMVTLKWYGGTASAIKDDVGTSSVQIKPPADDADDDVKKWNGNWFGFIEDATKGAAFDTTAGAVGGVRLTSPFDSEVTRTYCWGDGISNDFEFETGAKCDVNLGRAFPGASETVVNQALVDKATPVSNGGVKEDDFRRVSYVTDATTPVVIKSPGLPNNCVEGSTCADDKVQTMGEYSFASSINSFAVVMGASIAALVGIAAP